MNNFLNIFGIQTRSRSDGAESDCVYAENEMKRERRTIERGRERERAKRNAQGRGSENRSIGYTAFGCQWRPALSDSATRWREFDAAVPNGESSPRPCRERSKTDLDFLNFVCRAYRIIAISETHRPPVHVTRTAGSAWTVLLCGRHGPVRLPEKPTDVRYPCVRYNVQNIRGNDYNYTRR